MDIDEYRDGHVKSPPMGMMFLPLRRDRDKTRRVNQYLEDDDLGATEPYVFDDTLRDLYWRNLLTTRPPRDDRGSRLVWRCEAIRQAGREILR